MKKKTANYFAAKRLHAYRDAIKLSVEHMADALGVDSKTLRRMERNKIPVDRRVFDRAADLVIATKLSNALLYGSSI